MSLGAFLGARLGLFLAGVEGGRRAVEVGLWVLLLLVVFVLLGGKAGWPPRRVDRLAVWLGFVGEYWEESLVRYGAGQTAWGLAAVFGVGLVSGVFGVGSRWALVPEMVMGLLLEVAVACSEVAIALGDAAAATYLSAGFRLFGVDAGGGRVGGFSWGADCGVWRRQCGWWFWGFASRRGYAVTCGIRRSLVDGGCSRRFSLCRGRGGGWPASFRLGACGGRRLGGIVV